MPLPNALYGLKDLSVPFINKQVAINTRGGSSFVLLLFLILIF